MYIPLQIKKLAVYGVEESLLAMRLPHRSFSRGREEDLRLARKLVRAGDSHSKALRGIVAYLHLKMQVGFMVELETYRIGVEVLSTTSTMHNELKGLSGPELAEYKQHLLENLVYERILMVSYQALRRIYLERLHHRHPDWSIFCQFITTLDYFDDLIGLTDDKKSI